MFTPSFSVDDWKNKNKNKNNIYEKTIFSILNKLTTVHIIWTFQLFEQIIKCIEKSLLVAHNYSWEANIKVR